MVSWTSNEPGREAPECVYMKGGAGTFVAMETRPCVDSLVLSPTNQELVAELCGGAPQARLSCHLPRWHFICSHLPLKPKILMSERALRVCMQIQISIA